LTALCLGEVLRRSELYWASYRRTGFDRVRLGLVPIRCRWLLALLSVLLLSYVPTFSWLFGQPLPFRGIDWQRGLWLGIAMWASLIVVTPIARGAVVPWLAMERLGKHWPAVWVMPFTGSTFWLMHTFEGRYRLFGIVPPTIVFTLVRRYCDSVTASMWLHVLNNGTAMAVLVASIVWH
jgi:hypothetical protein